MIYYILTDYISDYIYISLQNLILSPKISLSLPHSHTISHNLIISPTFIDTFSDASYISTPTLQGNQGVQGRSVVQGHHGGLKSKSMMNDSHGTYTSSHLHSNQSPLYPGASSQTNVSGGGGGGSNGPAQGTRGRTAAVGGSGGYKMGYFQSSGDDGGGGDGSSSQYRLSSGNANNNNKEEEEEVAADPLIVNQNITYRLYFSSSIILV